MVGLVLAAVAIIFSIALFMMPLGGQGQAVGIVTGFRNMSSETGNDLYASVRVADRVTLVPLNPNHNCKVGKNISLKRTNYALGARYTSQLGCI